MEEELKAWRAIGLALDLIDRDATGAIVTESKYEMSCPLCHRRMTGRVDHEPRYPSLPPLGHARGCLVVKVRAILYPDGSDSLR